MPRIHKIAKCMLAMLLVVTMVPSVAFASVETQFASTDVDSISAAQVLSESNTTDDADDVPQAVVGDAGEASADQNESEERLEHQVGDLGALSYVYIEQPVIELGQTQHIVVGFADDAVLSGDPELVVRNIVTGDSFNIVASACIEDAVLFELAADMLSEGAYVIESLNLISNSSDGEVIAFSFTDDEAASYSFDVVTTGDEADSSNISLSVYTISDDGSLSEDTDITSTLSTFGTTLTLSSMSTLASTSSSSVVVVLDPGHGGSDGGASANGLTEKELTLKIAQYCKEELEEYANVQVYLTRTDDTYVSLQDRVDYALSVGADVLVSIHLNSSTSSSAKGAEVIVPRAGSYYYEETYVAGTELGTLILKQIVALGLSERYVYSRDADNGSTYSDGTLSDYYTIIARARANGLLGLIVEHAFLSNASDAAFLSNEINLQALGVADATAIAEYFGLSKIDESQYLGAYDYEYYIAQNPDVYAAYGNDRVAVFQHFLTYGIAEGRIASPCFDLSYYRAAYSDLQIAFGDNNKLYYYHFALYGMSEGRQGSASFSVSSYYNQYPDLRQAFRRDLVSYYLHYIECGLSEGRVATGVTTLVSGISTLNGVDYSAVYDANYYAENNTDVAAIATFGSSASLLDDQTLIEHFVWYGMSEGRQGSASFSVSSYYNQYPDLRQAFRRDLVSYYLHYIECGLSEGRVATGVTTLVSGISTLNGVDYSAVYDANYYAENNTDVAAIATFGSSASLLDDQTLIEHFVWYGMSEGRQGSASFSVSFYRNRYTDLQTAFGSNLASYYTHYIQYGQAEGRQATDSDLNSDMLIMGESQTTVAQMVRRYQATGYTYPSDVYTQYGAATIEAFCQILYEEAITEGVRAEVVFAQVMLETGWLQFGGDVQADQCNFGGIGATGGVSGNSFNDWGENSVRKGLRAQVQHLKAYASTEALVNDLVDPRFNYVTRGSAPTVYGLSGTWAASTTYGERLAALIRELLSS